MLRQDRGELLRIERQMELESLDQIEQQHRHDAKQQHRCGVFGPAHLVSFVHARQAIEQSLHGSQNGIQECLLAIEDSRHEDAHGLGDRQDQGEKNRDL